MSFPQVSVHQRVIGACLGVVVSVGFVGLDREASGQTIVQLPSFHRFSYSGSAWVPDRGGSHFGGALSGFDRSSMYRTPSLGIPSRGSTSLRSVTDAQLRVQIIDHSEWDRAILGGTPEEFMRRHRAQTQTSRGSIGSNPSGSRTTLPAIAANSPAANVRATQSLPPTEEQIKKGKQLVRTGRIAASRGSREWAIHYYRLAQHYLDDRLAALAEKELQAKLKDLDKNPPAPIPSR